MVVNRRILIPFVIAVAVCFLLANVLYQGAGATRTISDVFWVCFLIGVPLLIVLSIVALVQSRRARAR